MQVADDKRVKIQIIMLCGVRDKRNFNEVISIGFEY